MRAVERITATEILDSRGHPTVLARCHLEGGRTGQASVPSGASTGSAEAIELRDGDPGRYGGLGCRKAVANITCELNDALHGLPIGTQAELDSELTRIDGTQNKSRVGANAILAVSLAYARAIAADHGLELWEYFSRLIRNTPHILPRLTINLFSGGKHAGQQIAIQDVLIVPSGAPTIDESLAVAYDIYRAAAELVFRRYHMRLLRADEGGLAPPFSTPEEMLETALDAIQIAGYQAGTDVHLAIDVAASHFYSDGTYELGGEKLSSDQMVKRLQGWVSSYPIVSVEDGLAEEDWSNWPTLHKTIGSRSLVVGDDLLCTNPSRIERAVSDGSCNCLLLKVNQVGTLTEAVRAYQLARQAGWMISVSVRSGETEDHWAADLAVGWQSDQFKAGSITQSERLAKYNRLLEIEESTRFPVITWPGR